MHSNQRPLVKNASDEGQIRNAQQKEKLVFERKLNDLKFILSTEQGRRFIWDLLSRCGIFKESADASGSWTYYKEGRRSVGLSILTEVVEADPDSYLKMMKDSKKE